MGNAIKVTVEWNMIGNRAPMLVLVSAISAIMSVPKEDLPGITKMTCLVVDGVKFNVFETCEEIADAMYSPEYYLGIRRDS